MKIQNRYSDEYEFSLDSEGNILWEGNFKHCRFAWPNVYDKAYEAYCADVDSDERMTMGEFQSNVHSYDADTFERGKIGQKYGHLVYSDTKKISMVDPSGGPYLSIGMDMSYIGKEFKGLIIDEFVPTEKGYKIIIKNGTTSNTSSKEV